MAGAFFVGGSRCQTRRSLLPRFSRSMFSFYCRAAASRSAFFNGETLYNALRRVQT